MATDTDQDQALPSDARKSAHLILELSEFTIIDRINDEYDFWDKVAKNEPKASAFIKSKWKYAFQSDQLVFDDLTVLPESNTVEFMSCAGDRNLMDWNCYDGRVSSFAIYLPDDVFAALRRAVEQKDIRTA